MFMVCLLCFSLSYLLFCLSKTGELGAGWRTVSGFDDQRGSWIRSGNLHHWGGQRISSRVRRTQGMSAFFSYHSYLKYGNLNTLNGIFQKWLFENIGYWKMTDYHISNYLYCIAICPIKFFLCPSYVIIYK